MALTVLIGGARSGKSGLAVKLARDQTAPVTVIATAEAGDEEMGARIDQHKRERPAAWVTVEEPLELAAAIASVPDDHFLILDCLTLWVSNMVIARGAQATESDAVRAAAAAAARGGMTVAVTNEVGLGVVPEHQLGRAYRDLLGRVNTIWAEASERAFLLVAGRALELVEGLP